MRTKRCRLEYPAAKPGDLIVAFASAVIHDQGWARVPMDQDADPFRPRQLPPREVLMAHIPHVGYLAVMPSATGRTMQAVVFDIRNPTPVVRRVLVHERSGSPVTFRNEGEAVPQLADVIECAGAPPRGYRWDPPADLGVDGWVPRRLELHEKMAGTSAIAWRGRKGRWGIRSLGNGYMVERNGRPVTNPQGTWWTFTTQSAAKQFCEDQDHV